MNAIFYVLEGGIPLRLMPSDYRPWQTVFDGLRKRTLDHFRAALSGCLRVCLRQEEGWNAKPIAAILES